MLVLHEEAYAIALLVIKGSIVDMQRLFAKTKDVLVIREESIYSMTVFCSYGPALSC